MATKTKKAVVKKAEVKKVVKKERVKPEIKGILSPYFESEKSSAFLVFRSIVNGKGQLSVLAELLNGQSSNAEERAKHCGNELVNGSYGNFKRGIIGKKVKEGQITFYVIKK